MRDWIMEETLLPWLAIVAGAVKYSSDANDWDALRFGVRNTDVERDTWYEYPLGPATVRVALDPGSAVVAVSVDGADHVTAELATATRIAQTYPLSRDR
jgi:hypothetical protein